jgi:hypothetical protein
MLLQKSGDDQSRGRRTGGLATQIALIDTAERDICRDNTCCLDKVLEVQSLLNKGLFPTSLPPDYSVLLAADTKIHLRKYVQYVQYPEGTAHSCLLSYR